MSVMIWSLKLQPEQMCGADYESNGINRAELALV